MSAVIYFQFHLLKLLWVQIAFPHFVFVIAPPALRLGNMGVLID